MEQEELRSRRIEARNREWKKARKRALIRNFIIVLAVIILGGAAFLIFSPGSIKMSIIKGLTKLDIVRNIIESEVGESFEENILDKEFEDSDLSINAEVEKSLSGFTNIALFGLDSRTGAFDSATRSDSIILVSIDNDTGAMKMVSVYRDTMMEVTDSDGTVRYGKVNSAYNSGGIQEAVATLNTNLDLNITDYVIVNFAGMTEIIDMLGGLDLPITEDERLLINQYCGEMLQEAGSTETPPVLNQAGDVHLNGLQATAYCRIRKVAYYDPAGGVHNSDFGRTARQRVVMEKLISKAKSSGISNLLNLAQQIMNMNTEDKTFIKTSMTYDEIMDLVPVMIDYNMVGSDGFPYTLDTPNVDGASMVVAKGMAYNVSTLHKFLFNEENYQVSPKVQEINDYLINYTGVAEERRPGE